LFVTVPSRFLVYQTTRQQVIFRLITATVALFCLLIGSLKFFRRGSLDIYRRGERGLLLSVLILSLVLPFLKEILDRVISSRLKFQHFYFLTAEIMLIAVACDFFFIALTRLMLRRAAQSNSFLTIAILAIGNACLAALLFIGPLVATVWLKPKYHA